MKVIICGGGTLGHVTPGISIAETIQEKDSSAEILFIGRDGGNENELITNNGFALKTIKISGLSRRIDPKNLKSALNAIEALRVCKKIIHDFSPDTVIGTGGYVCWPVLRAAQHLKIPTIIHESNVCPGLSTKLLAKKCKYVLLNFPGSEYKFKQKENLRIVGNPIRKALLNETHSAARKKLGFKASDFVILSLGGSGGSQIINDCALTLMRNYTTKCGRIKHVHICGKKYSEFLKNEAPELFKGHDGCKIYPFIENIAPYLMSADVIISRCGAMTLSEISFAAIPAILIPSSNVTDNHQYKNAELFSERGAAIVIKECDLNAKVLENTLRNLEKKAMLRSKMSHNIHKFYTPHSRDEIYQKIRESKAE